MAEKLTYLLTYLVRIASCALIGRKPPSFCSVYPTNTTYKMQCDHRSTSNSLSRTTRLITKHSQLPLKTRPKLTLNTTTQHKLTNQRVEKKKKTAKKEISELSSIRSTEKSFADRWWTLLVMACNVLRLLACLLAGRPYSFEGY